MVGRHRWVCTFSWKVNLFDNHTSRYTFAVRVALQFMHSPQKPHLNALMCTSMSKRNSSPSQGIMCEKNEHLWLPVGSPMDQRSNTGHCKVVRGNLVTWKSKKTKCSCSIKWRDGNQSNDTYNMWINMASITSSRNNFLSENANKLYCDNQAANNPVYHERTKHVAVDCHFKKKSRTRKWLLHLIDHKASWQTSSKNIRKEAISWLLFQAWGL